MFMNLFWKFLELTEQKNKSKSDDKFENEKCGLHWNLLNAFLSPLHLSRNFTISKE